ncbi:hypothetical protein [Pseudomonas syringae]|uniref:hypothetical protein n=1 Tax=Pseudomonas syringae TaxID=317 RepID=UPI002009E61C|nr:hypothetical protein [Pseudomonas syringae]MCK9707562.1 hypothetical protein [Pseudomonas syringae pv. syringae]
MTAFKWLVKDSPIESPWLRGTKTFGINKPVMLIDQFGGKQPYLINQQYWEEGELAYPACAKVVVDSNLLDGIAELMSGGEVCDGMRGFTEFVSREGWDISAGFFLTEQYAKSTHANFVLHATRRLRLLYQFLAMDTDYFLATGTVRLLPAAIEHYLAKEAADSLDDIAEKHVHSFITSHSQREALETVEATEIALLKMVLLREFEMRGASPAEQYIAYQQFISSMLNFSLARESQLALHYFSGQAGSLLGIKQNSSRKKAVRNISATAWDLLLLRTPELLLKPPVNGGHVEVAFVATHEHKLAELAQLMEIHTLFPGTTPIVQYDMTKVRDDVIDTIRNAFDGQMVSPISRQGSASIPTGLRDALSHSLMLLLPSAGDI